MKGWGEELYNFFDGIITIKNFSNYKERITNLYNLDTVKNATKEDDYLLIAFGYTDTTVCNIGSYPDKEDFKLALTDYINDMCYKGAIPILLTPIKTSGSDGELQTVYAGIIQDIAKEYDIPLIDLDKKVAEQFLGLHNNIYWTEDGRLLTLDGAMWVCKIIVEELDKIEVSSKPYMWHDVVNSVSNSENMEDAKYRVHRLLMVDDDGNEVYRFSDAKKITDMIAELCDENVQGGYGYIAVYKDGNLVQVDECEVLENISWQKGTLRGFPIDIELSQFDNCNITVKAMLWNDKLEPFCYVYQLTK